MNQGNISWCTKQKFKSQTAKQLWSKMMKHKSVIDSVHLEDQNQICGHPLVFDETSVIGSEISTGNQFAELGRKLGLALKSLPIILVFAITLGNVTQLVASEANNFNQAEPQTTDYQVGIEVSVAETTPTMLQMLEVSKIGSEISADLAKFSEHSVPAEIVVSERLDNLVTIGLESDSRSDQRNSDFELAQNETNQSIENLKPTILLEATNQIITEGETAFVTAKTNLPFFGQVRLQYEFNRIFLPPDFQIPGDLPMSASGQINIAIPTIDDTSVQENGSIIITLEPSEDYQIAPSPENRVEITVVDNSTEPAIVAIRAQTESILEGEEAWFEIQSTQFMSSPINIEIRTAGDYFATDTTFPTSVNLDGNFQTSFSIPTLDDETIEWSGRVFATILEGTGYQVAPAPDNTARVIIENDDLRPEDLAGATIVSIESIVERVTEGSPAQMRIISSRPTERTINLDVTTRGDYFSSSTLPTSISMSGKTDIIFEVPTIDDETTELSGRVIATILEGEGYRIANAPFHTTEVIIEDDDALPTEPVVVEDSIPMISFTAISDLSIVEGETIEFWVYASVAPANDITINIGLGDTENDGSNDFVDESFVHQVVLPALTTSLTTSIQIADDDVVEDDGIVVLQVLAGDGYDKAGEGSIFLNVADNDTAVETEPDQLTAIPVISIEPINESIDEGLPARFRVVSTSPISVPISLSVFRLGLFFPNVDSPTSIDLSGGTEGEFEITTIYDRIFEVTGSVTATIVEGNGYTVADSPQNVAVVTVNSSRLPPVIPDVSPIVSIVPVRNSVVEGIPAQFRVTSTQPLSIPIALEVTTQGDYFTNSALPTSINLDGAIEANFEVPTINDETIEWSGRVFATILAREGYVIAESPANTATVIIENDDLRPEDLAAATVISIESVAERVTEGNAAQFRVVSAIPTERTINIEVTTAGEYFTGSTLPTSIDMGGQNQAEFEVPTVSDDVIESNGQVVATVLEGEGYSVAATPNHTTTVIIESNDSAAEPEQLAAIPVISIEPITASINEGLPARFRVVSTIPISVPISLSVFRRGLFFPNVESPTSIDLSGGTEGEFEILTVFDRIFEVTGSVTATLIEGNGYTVADSPRNVAVVTVNSSREPPSEPEIPVSAPAPDSTAPTPETPIAETDEINTSLPTVTVELFDSERHIEGDLVDFRISISEIQDEVVSVNVFIDDLGFGRFLTGDIPLNVTIPANEPNVTITVETDDDNAPDANGLIVVELMPGLGYRLAESRSAIVEIVDNDSDGRLGPDDSTLKVPEIDVVATKTKANEGEEIGFEFMLSQTTDEELLVNVFVADLDPESGSDYIDESTHQVVTIPANTDVFTWTWLIPNDNQVERDGPVVLRVLRGEGYEIGRRARPIITIADAGYVEPETVLPVVSIVANTTEAVMEGSAVEFTVSVTGDFEENLAVSLGVSESGGDHFDLAESITATISTSTTSTALTYTSVDDSRLDGDGTLVLTIQSSENYTIGEANQAEIRIIDNDKPVLSIHEPEPGSFQMSYTQAGNVTEGNDAFYFLGASFETGRTFTVRFEVDEHGTDFVRDNFLVLTHEFDNGHWWNGYFIYMISDEVDEPDGIVTVRMVPGPDYLVDPENSEVTYNILDNDDPQFSIATNVESVEEGEDIEFTVSGVLLAERTLDVLVENESGDFVANSTHQVVFDRTDSASFTVSTIDDEILERDGSIRATIVSGDGYSIKADSGSTSVQVTDNEPTPEVAISAVEEMVKEGESILISFTASEISQASFQLALDDQDSNVFERDIELVNIRGRTEFNWAVRTREDYIVGEDVQVNLTILPNEYITVAEDSSSVVVTVVDDESIPTITVASVNEIVFEGESVQFRLTSSLAESVSVNYFIVDSNGLSEGNQVVSITGGEAIVEIATESIPGVQEDGTYSIRILDGSSYNLVTPIQNNSASVTVTDHEEIRVSVTAPEFVFEPAESAAIRYTVELSRAPEIELLIQLSVENTSLPEQKVTEKIVFQAGETTQVYEFPIQYDQQFQTPYNVVTTVLDGEGFAPLAQKNQATVTVLDSSTPEVSIVAESSSIVEGSQARFNIATSTAFSENTNIEFQVSGSQPNIIDRSIPTSITIPANSTSIVLEIQSLRNEAEVNEAREITVNLSGSRSYQLGANSSATVTLTEALPEVEEIVDSEVTALGPVISIQLVTEGDVTEGDIVELTILASEATTENLDIRIDVNEGITDFFNLGEFIPVTLLAGETAISMQIASVNDDIAENEGELILSLGEGEGYQIGEQNQISIFVNDDEGGLEPEVVAETEVDTDPTGPVLSITSQNEEPITEGEIAEFRITASSPPEINLEISIIVGENGLSFFNLAEIIPITLFAGEVSVDFTIASIDDEVGEANDLLEFSIGPGVGYQIGESSSATVSLLDNDTEESAESETNIAEVPEDSVETPEIIGLPIVSIALASDTEISEGSAKEVLITSASEQADDLEITLSVTNEVGNYVQADNLTTTIEAGTNSVNLNINTIDDETWDVDGSVLVSLVESEFYQITEPFSVTFVVLDNDAPEVLTQAEPSFSQSQIAQQQEIITIPEVSISSSIESVIEGESAVFTLVATEVVEELIAIDVSFVGDFQPVGDLPLTVNMSGETSAQFEIPTRDTSEFEQNGEVTVTVLTGTSYIAASEPNNSASITIENNEPVAIDVAASALLDVPEQEPPILTISALDTEPVYEGDIVIFQLNSTVIPEVDFNVNIQISDVDTGFNGDFIDENEYSSMIFRAFDNRMIFDVPIEEDETDELDGQISMEILPGEFYIVGDPSTATTEILDNDEQGVPEIHITSVPTIETGKNAEFRIISNKVLQTGISVNVRVSGQGLLWANAVIPVQILTGETEARLFVPTDTNTPENQAIFVDAELLDGQGYVLSESQIAVSIELQEEIEPNFITVSALNDSVDEGFPASFRITSSVSQPAPLNIWVDTRTQNSGQALRSEVRSLALPAGAREMTFDVQTEINDFNGQNGNVVVDILPGNDYEVGNFPENSAEVTVINNVIPVINIRATRVNGPEGERFEFDVTARPVPQEDIEINLNVSETSSFLTRSGADRVILRQNDRTAKYAVETEDDIQTEADGEISVTILPGENYKVATRNGSIATSQVSDNDSPRVALSFAGGVSESTIAEGENIELVLTSTSLVATDLVVNLGIKESSGDYILGEPELEVIIPANQTVGSIIIPTVDDDSDEDNGNFAVTLLPGVGYNLNESSVEVTTILVDNDEGREIAIFAGSEIITEGADAIFNLSASGLMNRSVDLLVVSGGGDFLTDEVPLSVFFENSNEAEFIVPTLDDEVDEADGDISVSLIATDNYTLGEENTNASVPVLDNDDSPVVSIVATQTEPIIEGDSALFEIIATGPALRVVSVEVSDGESDFLVDGDTTLEVNLNGQSQATLELLTKNSETLEENTEIIATILPGTGYEVAESPADIATTIIVDALTDLDTLPEIGDTSELIQVSIQAVSGTITEGEVAVFELTATGNILDEDVIFEVSATGDVIGDITEGVVNFDGGETVEIEVATENDAADEENATVQVTLVSGLTYTADESQESASVQVLDDDLPVIELISSLRNVVEGTNIGFSIRSQYPVAENLSVKLAITDGDATRGRPDFRTVTILAGSSQSNEVFYNVEVLQTYLFERRIIAEIVDAAEFDIASSGDEVEIIVTGDSSPIVSVEPLGLVVDPATRVEVANFRINASFALAEDLDITVDIRNGYGDLSRVVDTIDVTLLANDEFVEFGVENGRDFASANQIVVEIVAGSGYELSPDSEDRNTSVSIDKTEYVISISATQSEIVEGNNAEFTISSSPAVESPLEITLEITEGLGNTIDATPTGDFINESAIENTITILEGSREVTLQVPTIEDEIIEPDGRITVELVDTDDYNLSENDDARIASVSVTNNLPVISIVATSVSPIEEGGDAQYRVISSLRTLLPLVVNLEVSDGDDGEFLVDSIPDSVTIPANESEVILNIETIDDEVLEDEGQITVEILDSDDYELTSELNARSASIAVTDNDTPVISIIATSTGPIDEGADAQYQITSSVSVPFPLVVNYSVSDGDSSDFVEDSASNSITLPANDTKITLNIDTNDDDIVEASGEIVARLLPGTNYTLAPADSSLFAIIAINDNEIIPVVTILPNEDSVEEGDVAEFNISITPPVDRVLTVKLGYNQRALNDFITGTPVLSIEFLATQAEKVLMVPTLNDTVAETNGEIKVSILEDINYTLNADIARQSATIPVTSDDVPVISVSSDGDIIEGQTASFRISSDIELSDSWVLDVRYALAGGDDFIASGQNKVGSVTFGPIEAEQTQSIQFRTEDDNRVEDDELGLTLTIQPSGVDLLETQVTYNLGPNSSDTLAIRDNDNNAMITVTSSHQAIMEGEIVTYTISADERKDPSKNLEIRFELEDVSGDFLITELEGENKIVLEDNGNRVSNVVHVTIDDNDIDQAAGSIRFKLLDYQPSQGVDTEAYDVSATLGSVETNVQDNDIPVISVEGGENITEGSVAEFIFSANIERQGVEITINFGVEGSTFFASSQSANDSIMLPAGGTNVTVTKSIETIDDDVIDAGDGMVTITITNSSSNFGQPPLYSVSSEDGVAVVEVFDNDTKPTISISGGRAVTEGTDAIFTVITNQSLGQDLGFGYSFTEGSHNFIASTHTTRTGTVYIREGTSDGQTEILPGEIEIPTEDDLVDEANGTITVNLYSLGPTITEYQLDPNNSSATVIVNDNDVPAISVTTDGFSVAEGRDAVFMFSADIERSSGRDIIINFGVVGTENYLHSSQPATDSIELPAGETDVTVTKNIRTNDLSGSGPDGRITVTITNPTVSDDIDPITYTINNGEAFVPVRDNDRQGGRTEGYNDEFLFLEEIASAERSYAEGSFNAPIQEQNETGLPRVSISSPNERVKEGEVIYFEVSLDSPVSEPIIVRIKVSEESGRFLRYTEREGPLIIGARSSRTVIKVETIDDIVFDGEGTVTAEIQEDNEIYVIESGNAEVTVFDIESEELSNRYSNVNDNVLPDLIQSMSANLVDSISNRVARASTVAGLEQVQFEVGGYNSLQDILEFKANEINDSANSWTSLLENSSFQLPLLSAAGDTIPVTVWGIGDHAHINESDPNSTVSQDGELFTAQLGFDARYENGLLTGVAISRFESDLEFTNQVGNDSATEGTHQVQINSAQPYLAWTAEERVFEIWGSAGYGQGTIQLDELVNDESVNQTTIDTSYYVTAIGASNRLFESDQIFGGEGELRLRGEVWSSAIGITDGPVGLSEGNYAAQRGRFATEATHTYQFDSEATFNSAISVGARWDNFLNDDDENLNEDDNSQLGFESGSEFSYDVPVGVKLTYGGRILVVPNINDEPNFEIDDLIPEWGARGELQVDLGQDNLGPLLYASPSWGNPQSGGIQGIWDSGLKSDSATRMSDAQMATELGYGLMMFDQNGILTPFVGATFKQYGLHEYSLGTRLVVGPSFNLELSGSRQTVSTDDIEWGASIKANYNW